MKLFLHRHGLSVMLIGVFLALWIGQAVVGRLDYNDDRREEYHEGPISFSEYLRSSHFLEATAENWESEFLQMAAYVFLTIYLVQRSNAGAHETEEAAPGGSFRGDSAGPGGNAGLPGSAQWEGWVPQIYEHSLGLAFLGCFFVSIGLHALGGSRLYSEQQLAHGRAAVGFWQYMGTPHFWFESLQNWQSEFLAIALMVIFSVVLRQRGSVPHGTTVAARRRETGD